MINPRDRAEEAKASIAKVIRQYYPNVFNDEFIEEASRRIYILAGRDIYEGISADMRDADRW